MKALNLHAVGDLRYEEVPDPVRQEGEVLLKIKACGICGSDIPRIFKKGTYHFPTIPGHEFSGEIVDADKPELIGKKAAVFPLIPCRKCASCQVGEYAQCSDYDYYGSRRDGAYAEYLAVKEWNLVFFDGISYEEAAMCEPSAVALHAVGLADIKVGDSVAIFGAGPIGMMLCLWAKASGASRIFISDIDQNKVDFAAKMGFDAINSVKVNAAEYIREATGGRGVDACIEGAGATQTWESCILAVKSFGHVVCMGNPFGDMTLTQSTYSQLLRKQLNIRGTWNSSYNDSRNDWRTTLDAITKRIVDVRPLITHRFALEDYQKAFDLILSRKEFYSKVMFTPEG